MIAAAARHYHCRWANHRNPQPLLWRWDINCLLAGHTKHHICTGPVFRKRLCLMSLLFPPMVPPSLGSLLGRRSSHSRGTEKAKRFVSVVPRSNHHHHDLLIIFLLLLPLLLHQDSEAMAEGRLRRGRGRGYMHHRCRLTNFRNCCRATAVLFNATSLQCSVYMKGPHPIPFSPPKRPQLVSGLFQSWQWMHAPT